MNHRVYDNMERAGVLQGRIVDIVDCAGHSAPLAVVDYENKERGYIFAPLGIRVNDTVATGFTALVRVGNTLPLKNIPVGTEIFNIEIRPADRGKLVRAAGSFAKVVGAGADGVTIELPSKQQRVFHPFCRATIGVIAGSGRLDKPFVTAGRRHHLMRARGKLYPITAGVAMNAVDHPFGSGRGRHVGKPKTVSRNTSPGAKVGKVSSRRTGRRR